MLLAVGGEARSQDADAVQARVEQQVLPALGARVAAAQARSAAAEAYFAGTGSLGAAFPELVAGRPGSEAWLRGRLSLLDQAGAQRAAERVAPGPGLADPALRAAWVDARTAALDAEEAAGVRERRVLLGLLQLLADHPAVSDAALDAERVRLRALVTRAEAAWQADPSEALARAVAEVQEDAALLEGVVAGIRRAATAPGAAPPDPARDLALLQEPGRALAAMARLVLLEPFLGPTAEAQVQAGELAVLQGPALDAARQELQAALAAVARVRVTDPVAPLDQLQARLAEVEADADAAALVLASLPPGEAGTVAGARRALAELRQEAARTWRDAAVMAVEVQQAGSRAVLDARYRAERAAAAREKAARAEANAETPEEWAAARLRMTEAQAAEHTAERAEAREQVRGRLLALRTGLAERLAALSRDRGDYAAARQLVSDVRGHLRAGETEQARQQAAALADQARIDQAREGLGQSRRGIQELDDPLMQSLFERVLSDWDEALTGQEALAAAGVRDQERHAEGLRLLLQQARRAQVAALPVATAADRSTDRDRLLQDLPAEWALLGGTLGEVLQERWTAASSVGLALAEGHAQRDAVLRTASGMLLLVIGWVWLRRRTRGLVALALRSLGRGRGSRVPQDLGGVAQPLALAARSAVDLVACWALLGPAWSLLPELALAVRILLSLAAWRLVCALFDLGVAEHPARRPAAFTLMPEGRVLAGLLVRGVALWAIVRALAQALVLAVLGSVPLALVLALACDVALLGLLVVVFHRWEPLIRVGLARWEEGGALARWLASPPRLPWLSRWLRGLLGVGLVFLQRLSAGFSGPTDRGVLGRLMGLFRPQSHHRGAPLAPLPTDLGLTLVGPADPARVLPRPLLDAALGQSLAAWQDAGHRGAVLVCGDRGHGKHTWLSQVGPQPGLGLALQRASLDRRLVTAAGASAWLSEALGLASDPDRPLAGLLEGLAARPPSIIVLEEVQRAFLRTVHGFDGLRLLLQVVARTGDRHFWVLSMHGPAWTYLSGLGGLLNLEMFRTVIQVPPWTPEELRLLVDGRARGCGAACSYDALVRSQPLGGDPDVARERTIGAWFRQLADASHGAPGVALQLWSDALAVAGDGVSVQPGARLDGWVPDDLTDHELFVLAALRVHDQLDEDELERVNNLDPMVVQATIRQLEARGLAWHRGQRVGVESRVQPALTQVLRRRQFLHGRA